MPKPVSSPESAEPHPPFEPETRRRVTLRLDPELNIVGCDDPAKVLGVGRAVEGRHLSSLLPEQSCLTRGECLANFSSLAAPAGKNLPADVQALATELTLSEQRFRLLFESNPLALWIYDLESFGFFAANDAAATLFGYLRAELLAMRVSALWPPEQKAETEREVTRPRGDGFYRVGVRTRVRKDGSRLQAEIHTQDIRYRGRRARLVVAHDMTERLRSERWLADENRVLGMLAGGLPLPEVFGALCGALAGECADGTRCTAMLLDNGRVNVLAAPGLPELLVQALHGRLLAPETDSLGIAVFGHEPVIVADIRDDSRCRYFRPLAHPFGIAAGWTVPIKSPAGAVVGALAVFSVTPGSPAPAELELGRRVAQIAGIAVDRLVADEELHRVNVQLEQRIRQRTAELEAANQELERFSYAIAHDLRAPLRAISGYSSLLLSEHGEKLDAEAGNFARRIVSVGNRMAEMIDGLLDLSRLSRAQLAMKEINLSEIVAIIAEELRSGDSRRWVEFSIQPDVKANADLNLIGVVLQNLLANAWKFTRDAERPRIEFGMLFSNGERAYFVRDNGAGFDMRYAEKLFAPFERLHGAAEYEGSGIGLATVRRVVQRHGGRVWADGRPGEGATFYFSV